MDIKRLQGLVESVLPHDRKPGQYEFSDVLEGLKLAGRGVSERTLYRQLDKLNIKKSGGGYYSDPDVILLLGWNTHRSRYRSCAAFFNAEGRRLYQIAETHFA